MGPAGLRLIARLETAPPIHIAQVEGAPQGDDCLYRGEVVEDVRDAIPAIEADGVRAAALAEGLGDAREILVAATASDGEFDRVMGALAGTLRRWFAETAGVAASQPSFDAEGAAAYARASLRREGGAGR
jgi:hypothetical protein